MVFSEIVGTLAFLQPQSDDDSVDRLHYYYTSTALLLFAVLISLKMFGGRPIECWMPAEYRKSWEDYTEMYCWARSTYFAPFEGAELPEVERRGYTLVSYYQWVPFYFVFVAFLFYAPCLLWRLTYDKSGIRLKDIMAFANDKTNVNPSNRRANIQGLAAHLASVCKHRFHFGGHHPHHHRFLRFLNLRFYEAYLSILYIAIKSLYLLNVMLQMYILNNFLSSDSFMYGYQVFYDLVRGRGWKDSENFPVVTFCDLQVRVLGNIQNHTVQCVLIINVFNEKIFLGLWLWFTLLFVLTSASLVFWVMDTIPFNKRVAFIVRRLELADVTFKKKKYRSELTEFVRDYVKMDGIFTLRMLTIHSNVLVCTEVVDLMWDQFLQEKNKETLGEILNHGVKGMEADEDERAGSRLGVGSLRELSPSPRPRKTSVLLPLVSREDLSMSHDGYLAPPSRNMWSSTEK